MQNQYARQIEEVKAETDSRAVAIATIRDTKETNETEPYEGERFKYVLEKEGQNWRVTEVFEYDKFELRGTKWRPVYEPGESSKKFRYVRATEH